VTTKSAATKRDPRGASVSERSNQTQQLSTPTAVDSGQQFVDDLCCDLLVVKVWARYIPPPHGTVESDQPRDAVPPKVARPKVA
jgi:hypothetical protein